MQFAPIAVMGRSRRTRQALLGVVALALLRADVGAQDKGEPFIGELNVQTIPPRQYLFGGMETDFKSMGAPIGKTLRAMFSSAVENKVPLTGPLMHFYHGAPHRAPDKGFKMETGFFVPEGVKELGDFKVRELPRFKCATMLYIGPGRRIGDAWQKLYRALGDKGLTPTDEERELYLYFEASDSPNNIVQVMVGIM